MWVRSQGVYPLNLLQCPCLENPWTVQAGCTVTEVAKSRTRMEQCRAHTGYILGHLTGVTQ